MDRYEVQIWRTLKNGPCSFWRLLDEQDEHIKGFVERLKTMMEEGWVIYEGGKFFLSPQGEKIADSLSPSQDVRCLYCRGGYNFHAFPEAWELYSKLVEGRPLPDPRFDQGFMTQEDIFARMAFMYERGDIEGQRILVLGDDDLFSLALSATGLPQSVAVLEVDSRLVDFIEKRKKENNFNLEVYHYNAADSYPLENRAFSVFVTDPVESEKGLRVTLSRGAQALRSEGALYFGLTTIESSWKKWYKIEKMLLEMNFVVTDILRRFSSYPDADNQFDESYYDQTKMRRLLDVEIPLPADVDWFRSHFLRCEAVEEPRPLVRGKVNFDTSFYLDDETLATPGWGN
ncbi:MAG TPA: bis-aminopropyl spermidine synthase family protein [Candidatus Atribacteria bacterium]|nr:bis-aminopropyl spermidine synthase family protein [Candidatus Atribacteria bacterium]